MNMGTPYYLAARFPNQQKAGATYFPLQQMIFIAKDECDLSVYRFKYQKMYVVCRCHRRSATTGTTPAH